MTPDEIKVRTKASFDNSLPFYKELCDMQRQEIDRLQRQNEIMKEALGNICIGLLGRSSVTANDWVNNAKVYAERVLRDCEGM